MLIDGPDIARATIILAHGAGAPMDTPYMNAIAHGLAAADIRVARFEFAYMAKRREDGKRRGPDRMPVLLARWAEILGEIGKTDTPLLIGGKSMGGRDPFGKPDEIAGYDLKAPVEMSWIPDGDHSFVPRKRSGHTEAENLELAVQTITAFVAQVAEIT
jgi:uncharacterized protein